MTPTLHVIDFAALAPFLILLVFALLVLLIESFADEAAKQWTFWMTMLGFTTALAAAFYAPASTNPLLTPWLAFDFLAKVFNIFFLVIGIACTLLAYSFFQRFTATHGEYFFLLLSAVFGLMLIGASADFLTLFLGIETLSIGLYILCGYMKKWKISHEAAIKYFLIGSLASAFLLYGIALIYGATGTTHFAGLLAAYQSMPQGSEKVLFLSGIGLVTLGFAFKAAIVPFHVWAPDVYDGAPTPVTAFMAVGTKVGAFAAFVRVFLVALPNFDPIWNEGISLLAYPTLIYANFVALRQTQLRRFFAYSGISHAGFLLIPLAAGTPDSIQALIFYLVVYALATLGCFAAMAFLDRRSEGVMLHDLYGLFKRAPWVAIVMAFCLLTLAGIPPTAGFFAKFYLFKVAFEAHYYTLVIVGLLMTVLSAFYYLRFVSVMFSEAPADAHAPAPTWPAALVGTISLAGLAFLSIYPSPLLEWIKK